MTALHALPADTLRLLHDADRALLALAGDSHYPLYHLLRRTCQQIAPVNSFYIGFFCPGEAAMLFPYSYDGQEYDQPEKADYGPDGITAWILHHRRAYWSGHDGGRLLNRGRMFGDTERASAESIVVPLARPDAPRAEPLLGLMGVLSYAGAGYDLDTVTALTWLGGSVATALHREQEDAERRAALGGRAASPVSAPASPADLLAHVSGVLQDVPLSRRAGARPAASRRSRPASAGGCPARAVPGVRAGADRRERAAAAHAAHPPRPACRPERGRAGRAAAPGGGAHGPRDRNGAVPVAAHGALARAQHPAQAGSGGPRRTVPASCVPGCPLRRTADPFRATLPTLLSASLRALSCNVPVFSWRTVSEGFPLPGGERRGESSRLPISPLQSPRRR